MDKGPDLFLHFPTAFPLVAGYHAGMSNFSIAAFYRNDKPDGIGVQMPIVPRKEAEGICQAIKACCDGYASDPDYPNEKILTGLKDFARRKDRLSEAEKIIAVAHIAWLEKQGLISVDEFNGVDVVDLDAVTMTPFWKFVG